jgi:uncharacterized protein
MFLFSAFLVGFLGSFHCIGMCGPIALSLPVNKASVTSIIGGRVLYNSGRIMTYALLGLVFGLIGHTISLAGFQKGLSIAAGISILLIAFVSYGPSKIPSMNIAFVKFTSAIKRAFRRLFGLKSKITLFLIGAVNGLLPCGFVYLALAGASATGGFLSGMNYMLLFGAGTVPVMITLSLAGNFFGLKFNRLVRRASPFIAAGLAVFLIVRGINMPQHSCCNH